MTRKKTSVLLLFVSKSLAAKLTHTKCGEEGYCRYEPASQHIKWPCSLCHLSCTLRDEVKRILGNRIYKTNTPTHQSNTVMNEYIITQNKLYWTWTKRQWLSLQKLKGN